MHPFAISIPVCRSVLSQPSRSVLWRASSCQLRVALQTRVRHDGRDGKPTNPSVPRKSPAIASARKVYFPPKTEDQGTPTTEAYAINENHQQREGPTPRVQFLRPAVFVLSLSTGMYCLCAYLEARKQVKEAARGYVPRPQFFYPAAEPQDVIAQTWKDLKPIGKLTIGSIAILGAVHLSKYVAYSVWANMWHIPAMNRNYQFLSHIFVHSGPPHLLFNMYAFYQFVPQLGDAPLFEGNANHMAAFLLSAGVLAGYAQHLIGVFKRGASFTRYALTPAGGASGALFAAFGAYCFQFPDRQVGIILLPFYFDAIQFLPFVMAFDIWGLTFGFKSLNLGHGAHLGGACIGIAYSAFDGNNKIWKPLVRFFRNRLEKKRSS
ncbi:hypothetical protein BCR34DRAFT_596294 [Clohesyomyces aquaticus]|uniref:Peptidase S54 rhomboid domain-containing protein n=1 Tax=Clohesyomyces aquaticus TaxID=1231657 RepID=A0A1Y2A7B2_9PLEO|nr:hypothetical protein BCR34DRAFT_596294 [Clohesyomyces aquaticus]